MKDIKILVISTSGVDKIHTQEKYENALDCDIDLDKKVLKLGVFKELANKDLALFINTNCSVGNVAFRQVRNTKSLEFPEKNCSVAWDRLVSKNALHTALSLLKLKREIHNRKLEWIAKDPDEWISNLEGHQIQMNKFGLKDNITGKGFMILLLNICLRNNM